jgi:hypothetical protein
MDQKNKVCLNKKHIRGLRKHSNDINSRKYPAEDMMSVGRDKMKELNKDDASFLFKWRVCIVVSLLGYMISLSSFIQKMILLYDGSTVNSQTIMAAIIIGVIGLAFQLAGLIIFHRLRREDFGVGYCNCINRANSFLFVLSNIKFILSILEVLSTIFLKSDDVKVDIIRALFIFLVGASGTFYFFLIVPSIYILVTGCLASESQLKFFEKEKKQEQEKLY